MCYFLHYERMVGRFHALDLIWDAIFIPIDFIYDDSSILSHLSEFFWYSFDYPMLWRVRSDRLEITIEEYGSFILIPPWLSCCTVRHWSSPLMIITSCCWQQVMRRIHTAVVWLSPEWDNLFRLSSLPVWYFSYNNSGSDEPKHSISQQLPLWSCIHPRY